MFHFTQTQRLFIQMWFRSLFFVFLSSGLLLFVYYVLDNIAPASSWSLSNFYSNAKTIYGAGLFIIIPLVQGFVFGRIHELRKWYDQKGSIIIMFIDFFIAVILLREGAICLIMATPLVFGLIVAGTLLGAHARNSKNRILNV